MKWLASVLATVLLFAGCASSSYIDEKVKPVRGDLRGMVYDLDRVPVSQATVVVQGTEKGAATDVQGHFTLPDVTFGPVTLVLQKPGYEAHPWTFDFGEVSQVVYVQLANGPQLFDAAADALELREWTQTAALLKRAFALEPDSPDGTLLSALLEARQGRAEAGLAILETYLERSSLFPVLELAAADLAERDLKDPARALIHLERAQALRYDPEVDLRIRTLKAAPSVGQPSP